MGDMCCLIKWIGTYGSPVMSAHIHAQSPCCAGTNFPREPPRKRIHMHIRVRKRLQTRCIKPPHNKGTPYTRFSFSSLIVRTIFVQAEVQCCNIRSLLYSPRVQYVATSCFSSIKEYGPNFSRDYLNNYDSAVYTSLLHAHAHVPTNTNMEAMEIHE